MRRELFLTRDITPGFIVQDMAAGVLYIGNAARAAGYIGNAARAAGVSVDTIRFDQSAGSSRLRVAAPADTAMSDGGQIRDLTFVRHGQELGFSLIEIKELLALRQKHHVCSEV